MKRYTKRIISFKVYGYQNVTRSIKITYPPPDHAVCTKRDPLSPRTRKTLIVQRSELSAKQQSTVHCTEVQNYF